MSNLIPVSRKEQYLSKIDGMTNKSPDKTYTKEEYFFSEILGEALHKPVLETRYEMYLAKIAGREIGIPYPETRLERFLAKAAGMDISVPTPITREEMYWSTYSPFYLSNASGEPPFSYNSVTGTLNNYRIYGQTVDGESVGDRTANLFDGVIEQGSFLSYDGTDFDSIYRVRSTFGNLIKPGTYTISCSGEAKGVVIYIYDENKQYLQDQSEVYWRRIPRTFSIEQSAFVRFAFADTSSGETGDTHEITPNDIENIMLNEGYASLPYAPYGYKVPVTVRGINILPMSTTPISMEVDDFYCEYDGAGTITLTTDKDNAVLGGFSIPLSEEFIIPVSVGQGGDGCVQFNNSIANSVNTDTDHLRVNFWYNTTFIDDWGLTAINRINSTYSAMARKTINRVSIDIVGTGFGTNRKIVIQPAFVLNTTKQVPFEPYHAPITTPIYLPEQIRKVGDEAEYIDYAEQKQYRVRKNLLPNADWVEGYIARDGRIVEPTSPMQEITSPFVKVIPGKTYVFSYYPNEGEPWRAVIYYTEDKMFIKRQSAGNSASPVAFTVESGVGYVRFSYRSYGDGTFSQLELGDTVTDYEPYIENTDLDVTLPALPTLPGTNVLSVGTEVQPSHVFVEFYKEREYG